MTPPVFGLMSFQKAVISGGSVGKERLQQSLVPLPKDTWPLEPTCVLDIKSSIRISASLYHTHVYVLVTFAIHNVGSRKTSNKFIIVINVIETVVRAIGVIGVQESGETYNVKNDNNNDCPYI